MDIVIECKEKDGFIVRIKGLDKVPLPGARERYYQKVMGHVVGRMDNYYDANGLSDIDWKLFKTPNRTDMIIEVLWNDEYQLPDDNAIISNVKRWIEEVVIY